MKRYSMIMITAALVGGPMLRAQNNPLTADTKGLFGIAKNNILKAAEKMPEENYSFKPTPEVRSFGQILAHVADAQYLFCSAVKGEKVAPLNIEKTKTSKADLTTALKDAFAYCEGVLDAVTDASAVDKVKFFGAERTKLIVLNFNTAHTFEHYGNLVTYMRLKGLVPPSSESSSR